MIFFAVYNATKEARRITIEEGKPVLIETMTYRVGHHSTSDDQSRYREQSQVSGWQRDNNPINRLRVWLEAQGLWDEQKNKDVQKEARNSVLAAMKESERLSKPKISELFNDVYLNMSEDLKADKEAMFAHIAKYPNEYPISLHEEE